MRTCDEGSRGATTIGWAACGLVAALGGGCYSSAGATDDEPDDGADEARADRAPDDAGLDAAPDGLDADRLDADGRDTLDGRDDAGGDGDAATVVTSAGIQLAGDYSPAGSWAWLCRCEGPRPPPAEVWAEEAGCKLTHDPYGEPPDPSTCRPLDFGVMTLSFAGHAYTLEPFGEGTGCAFTFRPALPPIAVGEVVRLTSTGGADLPPFDVELTMPPQVTLAEPGFGTVWVAGEAWSVRWEPAVEVQAVLRMPARHLFLLCRATTFPPLVVPATITALWDEFDVAGSVNFLAVQSTVVAGDTPLTIELGWGDLATVTFAPAP